MAEPARSQTSAKTAPALTPEKRAALVEIFAQAIVADLQEESARVAVAAALSVRRTAESTDRD
jgi:hypothetical protein